MLGWMSDVTVVLVVERDRHSEPVVVFSRMLGDPAPRLVRQLVLPANPTDHGDGVASLDEPHVGVRVAPDRLAVFSLVFGLGPGLVRGHLSWSPSTARIRGARSAFQGTS